MKMVAALLALVSAALPALAAGVTVRGPEGRTAWYEKRVPELLREVEAKLGADYGRDVTVVLARTDADFRREAPGAPSWAAAVARAREATLVVRLSALGPTVGTSETAVLRHELVHLVLPERIGWGASVPRWFEEGLAEVVGGRLFRIDSQTLPLTAAAGRLIPLSKLGRSFPESPSGAALAYAQGESAVEFLLDREGRDGLMALLDRLREGDRFDAALEAVYGLTQAKLEKEWKDWIEEEGRPWWEVILSVATIPFLLFVASLLVIAAFLRARRRGRRIYDSLPE
jgi:hypothetical protein